MFGICLLPSMKQLHPTPSKKFKSTISYSECAATGVVGIQPAMAGKFFVATKCSSGSYVTQRGQGSTKAGNLKCKVDLQGEIMPISCTDNASRS